MGNETKKAFFHISDLVDAAPSADLSSLLKAGDEVEFQLSHNSRNGKISACKIKKTASAPSSSSSSQQPLHPVGSNASLSSISGAEAEKRPERLNIKLKVANIDEKSGNELVLIRQPSNPDTNNKAKSFTRTLVERTPGNLNTLKMNSSSNQLNPGGLSAAVSSSSATATTSEAASPTPNSASLSILDLLMAASNTIAKQ
jgi:predicted RNA-binding protein with RPS1 domain